MKLSLDVLMCAARGRPAGLRTFPSHR